MDNDEILARLNEREEDLKAQLAELAKPVDLDGEIGFGKRIGDGTIQAVQAFNDSFSAQNLSDLLAQVRRAKQKLAEDTYGKCDECGEEIGKERLEFRPWSSKCVKHAV